MIFADASEDLKDVGKSIEIVNINGKKLLSGLHTLLARQKESQLIIGFGGHLFMSDSIRKQIQREAQGAKVLGISATRLSNTIIYYPTDKAEQQKIASCLSSLDDLITAQSQKLEALKEHKKGLMQQLFPAEGETVPKLRFPEFRDSGEWEEKIVGEIAKVTTGGTPLSTNDKYWNGDVPWMNSGELNLKRVYSVSNKITLLGLKESSTRLIPAHCILIGLAGQGKTRGTAAINYIELCTNQSIAAIQPNNKVFDSEFLYQRMDSMYDELRALSTGEGGRGGLNLQIIKSIKLYLPNLKEQQKIASCLSSLDDLITAQTEKIEGLKEHKKGLMQGLFPNVNVN
jgi:type I restriction enzyme S subunit